MRSPYLAAKQTKELLARSSPWLKARLSAADMLTVAQAASCAQTEVATMRRWVAAGRAIALKTGRHGCRLPRWQFEPAIWDAIPHVAAALGTTQGWSLLNFLEGACGALSGRTPRQAIEQGDLHAVLRAGLAESH